MTYQINLKKVCVDIPATLWSRTVGNNYTTDTADTDPLDCFDHIWTTNTDLIIIIN